MDEKIGISKKLVLKYIVAKGWKFDKETGKYQDPGNNKNFCTPALALQVQLTREAKIV